MSAAVATTAATAPKGSFAAVWQSVCTIAQPLWLAVPYRFEVLLFLLAFITRFWGITYPNSIVFDEIHFGGFVRDYDIGV
jgi:dolichyl-phosphate-mannose-protein mannosyltransferase